MQITREDVRRVAELARLDPSDEQVEIIVAELGAIIGYVEKLAALDVSDVPPTTAAFDVADAFREDVVRNVADVEALLANAPDRWQTFFRVPKIIE